MFSTEHLGIFKIARLPWHRVQSRTVCLSFTFLTGSAEELEREEEVSIREKENFLLTFSTVCAHFKRLFCRTSSDELWCSFFTITRELAFFPCNPRDVHSSSSSSSSRSMISGPFSIPNFPFLAQNRYVKLTRHYIC